MNDNLNIIALVCMAFYLALALWLSLYNFPWRVRYNKIRRKVRGWLFDLTSPEAKGYEGICCCGSPVDQHGWGDGHSPVDMYHYHKDAYILKGEK